jgi:uncharacterized protein (UPF0276 family)
MKHSDFEHLPALGAGIGLRKQHFGELKKTPATQTGGGSPDAWRPDLGVNWLEITPENFMNFGGYPQAILDLCASRWPVVSHGVNLSIGSVDPLNEEYLDRLKTLLERTGALWYSDHMCFTSVGGEYFHDLLPLPPSNEAAAHVIARVKRLKRKIDLPFLLENPSYYVQMPGAEMPEAEFFCQVLEGADCGMLLDVNNVYVNSRNHGFDAKEFIRQLPLHRVGQIHMAGHFDRGDVIIDTHEGPIIDPVWDLYRFTIEAIGRPVSTLIEWDTNVPALGKVVAEAQKAQGIVEKLGLGIPSPALRAPSPLGRGPSVARGEGEIFEPLRSPLAERREAVGIR